MLVADGDSFLSRLEAKTTTEFQQECLYVVKERSLEIALRIAVPFGETDEFKNVWIADQLRDLDAGFGCLASGSLDDRLLVKGESCALIEQRTNLPLKLAFRPRAP